MIDVCDRNCIFDHCGFLIPLLSKIPLAGRGVLRRGTDRSIPFGYSPLERGGSDPGTGAETGCVSLRNKIIPYNPKLKSRARRLRKAGNLAESLLWLQLKGRQMLGYDFHRQRPIADYIVDFYCPGLKLAIEIDGVTHADRAEEDRVRQERIEALGVSVLRFMDRDVRRNLQGVLSSIEEWIRAHDREEH